MTRHRINWTVYFTRDGEEEMLGAYGHGPQGLKYAQEIAKRFTAKGYEKVRVGDYDDTVPCGPRMKEERRQRKETPS